MRLRAVLHHPELVLGRDRHDRSHIRGLSVKMDRNDTNRPRCDRRLDSHRIDREGRLIGVGEHNGGAGVGDHGGCTDPGMRRGDDLVAGPDFQRGHREIERIGAVST